MPPVHEHRVEAHPRGAQHVGLKPVADRQHLVLRRIAGEAAAHVGRSSWSGLPYHVDAPAEPLHRGRQSRRRRLRERRRGSTIRSGLRQCIRTSRSPSVRARRDSPRLRSRSSSTPVHARSVKSSRSAIRTPLPSRISRSPAVPMKPTGLPSALSAVDPRFAAGRDPRPRHRAASPMRASCCSTASAVRGALVIRMTHAPLARAIARSRSAAPGIEMHAVMDDAPDVAQDQPVLRDRARPRSSFEARLAQRLFDRLDVLGIVELAQRERRRLDIDDGDRDAGDEEAQAAPGLRASPAR